MKPTTRIHENAIKAWTLSSLLLGLILFIPAGAYVLSELKNGISWLTFSAYFVPAFFIYSIVAFLLPKIRWKRWFYEVSEKEIDIQRGIIITKRTVIPVNRIQHVDTKQGPIYKKYGLSTVAISTAATTHEIPALDDETANEVRNTISSLVQKVKEDV